MIFEKPDVLYFLLLLIIPILVHLFQLRKFKTTKFSNVALLERIKLQSRKSSTIKKWLILATRLLGLIFLILAFAKPVIPSSDNALQKDETIIYLDNSFSMELPAKQLTLLEEAKQNLWGQLNQNQRFSLLTNDKVWKNVTKNDIKADFFSIDFAPVHFSFENLLLKAESMFEDQMSSHSLIIITDGLNFEDKVRLKPESGTDINLIVKSPSSLENFSIASAQLQTTNTSKTLLAEIRSYNVSNKDVTVSLMDNEELIAKTKANFEESTSTVIKFDVSNRDFKKGILEIEPDVMSYDNKLFFSLREEKKINIIAINSYGQKSFLTSIYNTEKFNFQEFSLGKFDYSKISDADLFILNEIDDINPILLSRIEEFQDNGGTLIIIPNKNTTPATFKGLVNNSNIYQSSTSEQREITSINFDHPLFKNVFSEQIQNFDYPSTQMFLEINSSFSPILKYSNGQSFLAEKDNIYSFSSALNTDLSNFTNSPLVVPVFYNIALESNVRPELYSIIGEENKIDIKTNLKKDEILKLVNESQQVIPQQTKLGNVVQINTQYQPKSTGHFQLKQKDSVLLDLSFNYGRIESDFNPMDLSTLEAKTFLSIPEAFNSFTEKRKILELWIWMLIFAIGFFLTELLILRFLK
ncbi:BatA domain-containing protein [Psychroflexus lacisalsi]|uniref:BatA and WFA domain-containing protein n=1 Tax=Psychroflexus lacisalsi TaxID=503928 RepID=A0ABN1K9D4_9FLAO|nr:BatA domain-containing protein [Psychroflexus lacisalsi]MBZ9619826.1 BatA domain-containing protein [Psychroflexus lacisalsi]